MASKYEASRRAEENVNAQIRDYANKHKDEDIVIAWNIENPGEVRAENVYPIYTLPMDSQEIFEDKEFYHYTATYDVERQYKVRGDIQDFSFEKDWRGDYRLKANYGPDQYYTTHHKETRDESSSITIRAGAIRVKKGNGPEIVRLYGPVHEENALNNRAARFLKEKRGMFFKEKKRGWTIVYWLTHLFFFLLTFFFVALLPELAHNAEVYNLQLELIIFKAIAHRGPIPLCSILGWYPTIACWTVLGAAAAMSALHLCAHLCIRDNMDPSITPPDIGMIVCIILDVLAIASVYYLPFAQGLDDGIVRVICMFLSFLFIIFINGKLVITLCAPVFFVWSIVRTVYNPEVYFLTKEEAAEEKRLRQYIDDGSYNAYIDMLEGYLSLFA